MDPLTALNKFTKNKCNYAWFAQQADPQLLIAVAACALPARLDRALMLHILQSIAVGLKEDPLEMLAKIVNLPFVHRRPGGIYKYEPSAREFFDERLRAESALYAELSRIAAKYYAKEREVLVRAGAKIYSFPVREMTLHEIYHILPVDGLTGMNMLWDFTEGSKTSATVADISATLWICERQRRYIPNERLPYIWYLLGRQHYLLGDSAGALVFLQRAYDGDLRTPSAVSAAHLVGQIQREQGCLDESANALKKALVIGRELGMRDQMAQVLEALSAVLLEQGRLDDVLSLTREYVETLAGIWSADRDLEMRPLFSKLLNDLGTIYLVNGRYNEVAQALGYEFMPSQSESTPAEYTFEPAPGRIQLYDPGRFVLRRPVVKPLAPQDVHEIVSGSVAPWQDEADRQNIKIETTHVEPTQIDAFSLGIATARVLDEWVANAVKSSLPGTSIRINGKRTQDAYQITIENYGIAHSPNKADFLFHEYGAQPDAGFSWAVTAENAGLFMARELMEAHDVAFERFSRKVGSGQLERFIISLPLVLSR